MAGGTGSVITSRCPKYRENSCCLALGFLVENRPWSGDDEVEASEQ